MGDVDALCKHLAQGGFFCLPFDEGLLLAVTEKRTKEEIDRLVALIQETC
jgi:hypothetical protein